MVCQTLKSRVLFNMMVTFTVTEVEILLFLLLILTHIQCLRNTKTYRMNRNVAVGNLLYLLIVFFQSFNVYLSHCFNVYRACRR